MEEGTKSTGSPNSRRRFLNVIYFVDSNRTKSFKIQVKTAMVLASTVFLVCTWAIASSIILVQNIGESHNLIERNHMLLGTVFDYQVKFDHVYEKTYPKHSQQDLVTTKTDQHQDSLNLTNDSNILQKTSPSQTEVVARVPDIQTDQLSVETTQPNPGSSQDLLRPGTIESKVTLEDVKPILKDSLLKVSFAIKNLTSPEKIAGNLWGIADYQTDNGKIVKVPAPDNLKDLDDEYILKNLRNTERFAIRYYKAKLLTFAAPTQKGHFRSVKVFCAMDGKVHELINQSVLSETPTSASSQQPRPDQEEENRINYASPDPKIPSRSN